MFIHDSDLRLCPCESPFNGRVNYLRCAWFTLSSTSKLFYQFKSKLWWPCDLASHGKVTAEQVFKIFQQTLSKWLKIRAFSTLHFHCFVPLPCSLDRQSELDSDNCTCWCNTHIHAYIHTHRSGNIEQFVCMRVCLAWGSNMFCHLILCPTEVTFCVFSHGSMWVGNTVCMLFFSVCLLAYMQARVCACVHVLELSFNPPILRLLYSYPAVHFAPHRPIAFHIPPPSQDPKDPGCMAAGCYHGAGVMRSAPFWTSMIRWGLMG